MAEFLDGQEVLSMQSFAYAGGSVLA